MSDIISGKPIDGTEWVLRMCKGSHEESIFQSSLWVQALFD